MSLPSTRSHLFRLMTFSALIVVGEHGISASIGNAPDYTQCDDCQILYTKYHREGKIVPVDNPADLPAYIEKKEPKLYIVSAGIIRLNKTLKLSENQAILPKEISGSGFVEFRAATGASVNNFLDENNTFRVVQSSENTVLGGVRINASQYTALLDQARGRKTLIQADQIKKYDLIRVHLNGNEALKSMLDSDNTQIAQGALATDFSHNYSQSYFTGNGADSIVNLRYPRWLALPETHNLFDFKRSILVVGGNTTKPKQTGLSIEGGRGEVEHADLGFAEANNSEQQRESMHISGVHATIHENVFFSNNGDFRDNDIVTDIDPNAPTSNLSFAANSFSNLAKAFGGASSADGREIENYAHQKYSLPTPEEFFSMQPLSDDGDTVGKPGPIAGVCFVAAVDLARSRNIVSENGGEASDYCNIKWDKGSFYFTQSQEEGGSPSKSKNQNDQYSDSYVNGLIVGNVIFGLTTAGFAALSSYFGWKLKTVKSNSPVEFNNVIANGGGTNPSY